MLASSGNNVGNSIAVSSLGSDTKQCTCVNTLNCLTMRSFAIAASNCSLEKQSDEWAVLALLASC